jgi:hypothetical protein
MTGDVRRPAAEEYVRQLVEAAPPLTAEQRSRLAVLLTLETPQTRGDA